jgi:serine/threonine protein kinase
MTTHVGSRRYMSPEMKSNKKYNYKTDIWSAGIVFAELFENIRYDVDTFMWKKTPLNIQSLISQSMLKVVSEERESANELIGLFETVPLKKSSAWRIW